MEVKTHSKTSGRVPPQDIVAEKSLLGAIMISENIFPDIITIVQTKDFYEERHRIIVEAMMNLYDSHRGIDLLTLTAELKRRRNSKTLAERRTLRNFLLLCQQWYMRSLTLRLLKKPLRVGD